MDTFYSLSYSNEFMFSLSCKNLSSVVDNDVPLLIIWNIETIANAIVLEITNTARTSYLHLREENKTKLSTSNFSCEKINPSDCIQR